MQVVKAHIKSFFKRRMMRSKLKSISVMIDQGIGLAGREQELCDILNDKEIAHDLRALLITIDIKRKMELNKPECKHRDVYDLLLGIDYKLSKNMIYRNV